MRNNEPYYLGNDTELPVKLTAQSKHKTISVELPWDADLRDMLEAFETVCVGLGFHDEGVTKAMEEFIEERK